eukprot:603434-Hanusia_phi.AAC.1
MTGASPDSVSRAGPPGRLRSRVGRGPRPRGGGSVLTARAFWQAFFLATVGNLNRDSAARALCLGRGAHHAA